MIWSGRMLMSSSIIPVTLRNRVAKRLKMCLGSQVGVAPSLDVQQLRPNKDDKNFPNGESLSTCLTIQIICLTARYVESPSLASAQIGPFTFSPNSWVFQVSSTVSIHFASCGAFSVLSDGEETIGTGV